MGQPPYVNGDNFDHSNADSLILKHVFYKMNEPVTPVDESFLYVSSSTKRRNTVSSQYETKSHRRTKSNVSISTITSEHYSISSQSTQQRIAYKIIKLASSSNLPIANYFFGMLMLFQNESIEKALSLIEAAAEEGDPLSCLQLCRWMESDIVKYKHRIEQLLLKSAIYDSDCALKLSQFYHSQNNKSNSLYYFRIYKHLNKLH